MKTTGRVARPRQKAAVASALLAVMHEGCVAPVSPMPSQSTAHTLCSKASPTTQVTLLCWPSIGRLPFRRYFNSWPDDVVRWGYLGDTSAITRFAPRGRIGPTIRADVGIQSTHRMGRQMIRRPNCDSSSVGKGPLLARYINFRGKLVCMGPLLVRCISFGLVDWTLHGQHWSDVLVLVLSTGRRRASISPMYQSWFSRLSVMGPTLARLLVSLAQVGLTGSIRPFPDIRPVHTAWDL